MSQRHPKHPERRREGTRSRGLRLFAGRRLPAALRRFGWLGLPLACLGLGCGIAPKNFKALNNPAAIVRARSVAFGDNLPEWKVVPPLIERLNDSDAVVRLSAHEELRRRTGQDFGYVPWAQPAERTQAVERWRQWWEGRKAALAKNRQIP